MLPHSLLAVSGNMLTVCLVASPVCCALLPCQSVQHLPLHEHIRCRGCVKILSQCFQPACLLQQRLPAEKPDGGSYPAKQQQPEYSCSKRQSSRGEPQQNVRSCIRHLQKAYGNALSN